jgi:hypothetical protein
MIGTAVAIAASAVIGGAVSLIGGAMQADAAGKATKAQVASQDKSIAEARRQYDTDRADMAPWREAGKAALTQIQTGIADGSFDPSNFEFEADPGYEFRKEEGARALERSAAARGNLFSGATGVALTRYNQEFASNEYDRAYNRAAQAKTTNFNTLASVAGVGQRATETTAAAGQQATGQIIAANNNIGNAFANGAMAQGNAWANAASNVGSSLNTGIENFLLYKALG